MAPTQVVLRLDTKESADLIENKPSNTKPELNTQTEHVTNAELLDDIKEPLRLPTLLSYLAAIITLAIYAYALYNLFSEYQQNYFHKNTQPSAVKNYLLYWSPTFFIAVALEFMYGKYKKSNPYPPGDTLASFCVFVARTVTTRLTSMVRQHPIRISLPNLFHPDLEEG